MQLIYDKFQQTIEELSATSIKLRQNLEEHKIVLTTPSEVPSDRKCFRNLGEGLVETTAGEGKVALEKEIKVFEESLNMVEKEFKTKQEEFTKWKTSNNIKIVKSR
ncbi:unnamed protein product [Ambrosiozyma monospora]|uniref:Unnamed protein product n=1 Tax=Ambrosiozyma monospora TaxID=43982 RepID=A0ACB5T5G5_AMBMO|nr:unnamed protein product [Ambrosiozyma monospora]